MIQLYISDDGALVQACAWWSDQNREDIQYLCPDVRFEGTQAGFYAKLLNEVGIAPRLRNGSYYGRVVTGSRSLQTNSQFIFHKSDFEARFTLISPAPLQSDHK